MGFDYLTFTQPFILSLSKDERLGFVNTSNRYKWIGAWFGPDYAFWNWPVAQGRERAISRTAWGVVMGARQRSPMQAYNAGARSRGNPR